MDVGEKLQTPCEGTSAVQCYVSNKEKGNSAHAQDNYKELNGPNGFRKKK